MLLRMARTIDDRDELLDVRRTLPNTTTTRVVTKSRTMKVNMMSMTRSKLRTHNAGLRWWGHYSVHRACHNSSRQAESTGC